MKQLRAMRRQIQIQPALLQIFSFALVRCVAQTVSHFPAKVGEALRVERGVALALMRREIHDDQVKFLWCRLPLDENKILVRRISRPRFVWSENFPIAATDSRLA